MNRVSLSFVTTGPSPHRHSLLAVGLASAEFELRRSEASLRCLMNPTEGWNVSRRRAESNAEEFALDASDMDPDYANEFRSDPDNWDSLRSGVLLKPGVVADFVRDALAPMKQPILVLASAGKYQPWVTSLFDRGGGKYPFVRTICLETLGLGSDAWRAYGVEAAARLQLQSYAATLANLQHGMRP